MGELDRKHRYDFFKGFITSLGKKNLFDFEVVRTMKYLTYSEQTSLKRLLLKLTIKKEVNLMT